MTKLKYLVSITSFLLLSGAAKAEGFFEPGFGYFLQSTVTDNNKTTGDATTQVSAFEMNLNAGYIRNKKLEFAGFVDVIMEGSGQNSDAAQDYGVQDSTIGAQIGYLINDDMKAWFGYALQRSLTLDEDGERGLTIKGNGYLFGFGYKISKFYINTEYRVYSYNRGEYAGNDLDNADYTEETLAIGLSYPF